MSRSKPSRRFEDLINAATKVFILHGYHRAQMDDIAAAMGVSKGTLYNYVDSKEALIELVILCADQDDWQGKLPEFPVAAPPPETTFGHVRQKLKSGKTLWLLEAALQRARAEDVRAELGSIVHELFKRLAERKCGITLIDRSSRDYPELAELWLETRTTVIQSIENYLKLRIAARQLPPVPSTEVAARFVFESAAFWAVHRHWDLRVEPVSESVAEASVVRFVVMALAPPLDMSDSNETHHPRSNQPDKEH